MFRVGTIHRIAGSFDQIIPLREEERLRGEVTGCLLSVTRSRGSGCCGSLLYLALQFSLLALVRRWTLWTDFLEAYSCGRRRLLALLGQSLYLFAGLARHLELLFLRSATSHDYLEVEFVGKVL